MQEEYLTEKQKLGHEDVCILTGTLDLGFEPFQKQLVTAV